MARKNGKKDATRLWKVYVKMARLADTPEEDETLKKALGDAAEAFDKTLEKQRQIHYAVRTIFLSERDKAWKIGRSKHDIKRMETALEHATAIFEVFNESVAQQFIDQIGKVCDLWDDMKKKPLKRR